MDWVDALSQLLIPDNKVTVDAIDSSRDSHDTTTGVSSILLFK